jgi:hypothetical protein
MVSKQQVLSSKLAQRALGGDCWALYSTLPMNFVTWVNPLSWILNPKIMEETNTYGFLSNENRIPTFLTAEKLIMLRHANDKRVIPSSC